MKFSVSWAVMSTVMIAFAAPAHAAEPSAAEMPAVFRRLLDCRQITEGAARLACYDAQVAGVASAQQSRDLVVMDRAQVQRTRRSLFGFVLPRIDLFGGNDGGEASELETTIAGASRSNYRWRFILADGARWEQTDTRELVPEPRAGMAIRIRRAAMGSFLANVGNQVAIRVRRVQ